MAWIELATALGVGGILTALIDWFRNRKQVGALAEKTDAEADKIDVDTKLAYLGTVIDRLDAENIRITKDRDRILTELVAEQDRSSLLRRRVRELEDDIDGLRRSTRETQHKCDELALRLKELVEDAQESENS